MEIIDKLFKHPDKEEKEIRSDRELIVELSARVLLLEELLTKKVKSKTDGEEFRTLNKMGRRTKKGWSDLIKERGMNDPYAHIND